MNSMELDRGLREEQGKKRIKGVDRHRQVEDAIGVLLVQGHAVVQELAQGRMKLRDHRWAGEALDLNSDALIPSLGADELLSGNVDVLVDATELDEVRIGRDGPAFLEINPRFTAP